MTNDRIDYILNFFRDRILEMDDDEEYEDPWTCDFVLNKDELLEVFDKAIDNLDKSNRKELSIEEIHPDERTVRYYTCPSCHMSINPYKYFGSYCKYCGQSINLYVGNK